LVDFLVATSQLPVLVGLQRSVPVTAARILPVDEEVTPWNGFKQIRHGETMRACASTPSR
jgi:hypothetical protein